MRASVHLVRPHLAPPGPTDCGHHTAARRWLDPLFAVVCCLLDLLVFVVSGVWTGGLVTGAEVPAAGAFAVAAVAAPALAWRRRAPRLVFGGLWLHSLVSVLLCGYRPFVGLAVSLYTITTRERRTTALLALAAALVPVGLGSSALASDLPGMSAERLLAECCVAGSVLVGAWLVGQWAHVRHRQQTLLQEQRDIELKEAALAERGRVADELLSIITHCLSAMLLQAAGARRVLACDPEQAAKALTSIEASGMQATGELYRLLAVLRGLGVAQRTSTQLTAAQLTAAQLTAVQDTAAPSPAETDRIVNARADPALRATAGGQRHRALTDLQPFLDQARAAGVPVRVLTLDGPGREVASLDLSGGYPPDHRDPDVHGTIEMRWADGALELVVAAAAGGHVPTPRSTMQESLDDHRTVSVPDRR